ncbi:MAG TPA: hypothetical protein PKA82_13765, partial [Pyrinomonadaceae bacterium]|nr:hypothetical protein [Pyrinomonadaceae bacterium]
MYYRFSRIFASLLLFVMLISSLAPAMSAQSKPQRPSSSTGDGKKNDRPKPPTEEEIKAAEEKKR